MSASRRRVLLVGYGRIGREAFADYRGTMAGETLMVTDPAFEFMPSGFEWDLDEVDVAVVMVDTPAVAADSHLSGFDYDSLCIALEQYLDVAARIVIRSTVSLDFLDVEPYRSNADRIGFSPEFYGTTRHSRRGQLDLGFTLFSTGVPQWFAARASAGGKELWGSPAEVIVAKLAENAYLATKVTFFHELALTCAERGVSFDVVRELVTSDPRITPYHSYCDDGLGWSSHCFNKDVPVFAGLSSHRLVMAVLAINNCHLAGNHADRRRGPQEAP